VFKNIAAASGHNSQERKKGYVVKLLAASKGNEAGYIMRSLQVGGLRLSGAKHLHTCWGRYGLQRGRYALAAGVGWW